jgi:hypothetical protein
VSKKPNSEKCVRYRPRFTTTIGRDLWGDEVVSTTMAGIAPVPPLPLLLLPMLLLLPPLLLVLLLAPGTSVVWPQ